VYVDDMVKHASETGFRLPDVLKSVVLSDTFRMRRGHKEGK
jgi:hypothetical protein